MLKQRLPKSFWIIAILLWLPFPCLFAPFTFMRESYHPWYIGYTSVLFLVAIFFYCPSNTIVAGLQLLFGFDQWMPAIYTAAFMQSAGLCWLLHRIYRFRLARAAPCGGLKP